MKAPARYFPVKPGPLRMRASLQQLGTDFGNGAADGSYFQIDDEYDRYLHEKRACSRAGVPRYRRHGWLAGTGSQQQAHEAVLQWMRDTLHREHPQGMARRPGDETYLSAYDEITRNLQEDLVVVQRKPEGGDEVIMAHVCFPSGWRSDRILGRSFMEIHAPVPGFVDVAAAAASMVDAMVDRGPYVRFVWSLCADDYLDHHPDQGQRRAWDDEDAAGWLRVERQVTVPFPGVQASLFIIRTYLYPFASLSAAQRATLASAVEQMPAEVRRYKGFDADRARILKAIAAG